MHIKRDKPHLQLHHDYYQGQRLLQQRSKQRRGFFVIIIHNNSWGIMNFPQTLEEVSVQLIYGHGQPPSGAQNLFEQLYVSALFPFVLDVPANQVQLYLADENRVRNLEKWERIRQRVEELESREDQRKSVLPAGYHNYFMEIYGRSARAQEGLPECSFRIFSGRGYGTGRMDETHVKCGARGQKLRFAHLGAKATVLTILDVCGNPHAVDCMSDRVPVGDAIRRWKKPMAYQDVPFPLACVKSSVSWCCRVGWAGQHDVDCTHEEYKPVERVSELLSHLICFPVVNCVLAAVKARKYDTNEDRDLDMIFHEKFRGLNTRYLYENPDGHLPRTHANLNGLQQLIDSGILPVKQDAFDCILYQREREWFPTRELALTFDGGDKVGQSIVEFIIESILQWYRKDPEKRYWNQVLAPGYSDKGYSDYETYKAWHMLLEMVGKFRPRLIYEFFCIDEQNVKRCVDEDDSNVGLKDLALCYPNLPKLVKKVERWIATGIEGYLEGNGNDPIPMIVSTSSSPTPSIESGSTQ